MESLKQEISPMLWFGSQAEDAAKLYTSAFPNSKTNKITRYGKEGFEIHGQPEGKIMTAELMLDGYKFTLLNGGPHFNINPSISFFVTYEDADLIDRIWRRLSEGGSVLMPLDQYPWSPK